ncbi:hypothetical protein QFW85_12535 [Vibrio chagasii]|uniref:hypothetical protein n=1 Tax=Vibrio chagasii TaxID=170679 RepID=UPI003DA7DB54
MRDCDLACDLYNLFDTYARQEHFKPTAARLHEELNLTDCFMYLDRELKPDRLLAAALFGIHLHKRQTHYIEQSNKETFLQAILELSLSAMGITQSVDIVLPEQLPYRRSKKTDRLIQKISNGLIDKKQFDSKRQFNREVKLKGSELAKNRANTTSDLVALLAYCQKQQGQFNGLIDFLYTAIFDNLSTYFRSHERQFTARAKGFLSRTSRS